MCSVQKCPTRAPATRNRSARTADGSPTRLERPRARRNARTKRSRTQFTLGETERRARHETDATVTLVHSLPVSIHPLAHPPLARVERRRAPRRLSLSLSPSHPRARASTSLDTDARAHSFVPIAPPNPRARTALVAARSRARCERSP